MYAGIATVVKYIMSRIMEKREKLNCVDYAAFADYCNEKGLRIEINGDTVFGLEEWEKVVNGDVVSCLDDVVYIDGLKRQK